MTTQVSKSMPIRERGSHGGKRELNWRTTLYSKVLRDPKSTPLHVRKMEEELASSEGKKKKGV